ncbi:hypothetical protein B0H13DRAFT_1905095 [Mycena leptocephala]|nr:hypothetical protein B0H13DRAFT_1905095 [Mycena leptocephala]
MAKNSKTPVARSALAIVAHRQAAAKYSLRNEEEEREKARVRMAVYNCSTTPPTSPTDATRHRRRIREQNSVDSDVLKGTKERSKAADAKYRQKNAELIAFKQRRRHQEEYIGKHGRDAYQEHCKKEQERADAKWYTAQAATAEARRAAS